MATWCGTVEAATLVLGADSQSRYDAFGTDFVADFPDQPQPANTLTGLLDGIEYRSYFVFDVSSITSPVVGAKLRLLNKRYYSTESSESIELFDVSTPTDELIGGFGRTDIFDDLGSGDSYGSATLVANPPQNDFDNLVEEYFEVTLTSAAIAGIQSAATQGNGLFALGIKLQDDSFGSPYVFQTTEGDLAGVPVEGVVFSGGPFDPEQESEVPGELILELDDSEPPKGVPEPSVTFSFLAFAVAGGIVRKFAGRH
ncbi:MAG: hypothetical protein AAF722_21830 [Cyanobacteria bacterium P01_C01_bin.70]